MAKYDRSAWFCLVRVNLKCSSHTNKLLLMCLLRSHYFESHIKLKDSINHPRTHFPMIPQSSFWVSYFLPQNKLLFRFTFRLQAILSKVTQTFAASLHQIVPQLKSRRTRRFRTTYWILTCFILNFFNFLTDFSTNFCVLHLTVSYS